MKLSPEVLAQLRSDLDTLVSRTSALIAATSPSRNDFKVADHMLYSRRSTAVAAMAVAFESVATQDAGVMIAEQDSAEVKRWLYGVNEGQPRPAGDFLKDFVQACLRADNENYPILRVSILQIMKRYPEYKYEGNM